MELLSSDVIPNVNSGPRVILFLNHGDIVLIDDVKLWLNVPIPGDPDLIYFTTVDSQVEKYFAISERQKTALESETVKYSNYIKHVRDRENLAVMSRQAMVALIISGMYSIG